MISQDTQDAQVCCSRCGFPLPGELLPGSTRVTCVSCDAELELEVFPALFRGPEPVQLGDALQADTEASCFYHPAKRAVVACSMCGRFLCALCEVPLAGQRLCPNCTELARGQERVGELVTHRVLYDQLALVLAIAPMIMIWPTIITAPMALYVAFRYWKTPTSLVRRNKGRFIAAIVIAGLEIVGWTMMLGSRLF